MAATYEFKGEQVRFAPGQRLIDPEDVHQFEQAQTILARAQEKARLIEMQARQAYEEQRQAGYRDGIAHANDEKAAFCLKVANEFADAMKNVEAKLVDLLPQIVKKILGDVGSDISFSAYVTNSLKEINENKVIVKSHPSKRGELEEAVNRMLRSQESSVKVVKVASDNTLEPDQAVLETGSSIVVLDLERQIQMLEKLCQSGGPAAM